jgi:phage protein D
MVASPVTETPNTKRLMSQVYVNVNGTDLAEDVRMDMLRIRVEGSVHLPDMAILELNDTDFKWSKQDTIKIGDELKIKFGEAGNKSDEPAFIGEVVAIEIELKMHGDASMFVRAYDRSHRLHRGRHTKTYLKMKDSEIAAEVASRAGLQSDVETTQGVHDWVVQDNQTNWEFLQERASIHGFEVQVRDKTLVFKPPPSVEREEVPLTWSAELLSFKATKTTGEQVNKVEVRGWDPINKKEIVGKAENPKRLPELEEGENNGGHVAKSAFQKEATMVTAREPIFNQTQADRLAQTILDELAGGFITARGTAKGNPKLQLGSKVDIKSVGKHFTGKYVVTQITHRFEPEDWYVDFEVTGRRSFDFLTLVTGR